MKKVNTEIIQNMKPCEDRFNNWLKHYEKFDSSIVDFLNLENITYNDKIWVCIRLMSKVEAVKWSLKCAESVLHNFENKFPDDNRPRKALDAVLIWLNNPSEENGSAVESAWSAVWSAVRSAERSATRSALRSAVESAWSAAESARSAAESAMLAAESATRSARSAARSAAESAEKQQEEKNIQFLIEVLNESN